MMTLRANELGMRNTRFVNASGLPDSRQISTARDIAILSRAVMRDYPQYYGFFGAKNFTHRGVTMRNHNGMLNTMPGVDGIKTGYTNASGFNIAVSAVRNNNAEDLLLTGFSVMARRDRGEKITVAQNLFEPEPTGPVMRPSVAQGDGEQDGLKIVLASAPPPASASRTRLVESDATALRGKKGGKWVVQVGAFKSKADAKEQITFVSKRFGKHFKVANGEVGAKVGGSYRARFSGYTEASAKDACQALKAKRLACMVVRPT